MNIIEHLARTVTPVVLGNQANDTNRATLLEKLYAIVVARLSDNNVYNGFANTTVNNDDHGFFDRFLPDVNHRSSLVRELSGQYNVPEQETQSLVSRAVPLVYNELRNLAGTSSVSSFLGNNLSTVGSALPAWSYALIPAGAYGLLNINRTHAAQPEQVVKTTTRTEEHLVATPKQEEGGLMKILLPLIGLLILGALAWALLKGCGHKEEVATPVVASQTTTTTVVSSTTAPASADSATVVASTVTINASGASATAAPVIGSATDATAGSATDATAGSATTTTTTTTTISSTEPSVTFENGRLSFYFATGKADVAPHAVEKAQEILAAAKQGKKIGISGYTDSTGDAAKNKILSKNRAEAVKKFLVDNGVPASQLDLIKPKDTVGANGKDQEGRRVDAYIVDDNAIPAATATEKTTTTKTVDASATK